MKKKIIILFICIILFIYFVGGIVYNFVLKKDVSIKEHIVKSTNTIKNYDYLLYDDDLDIYIKEFKNLKKNLESDKINYEDYAYSISKMFIIQIYSLGNINNKYNVKGTEFVYPDAIDNFKLNILNTLNKYIEDNSDGDRKQVLPIVKNVDTYNLEEISYKIGDEEFDAYKIKLSIEYIKDLGYDNEAELILVKKDKYLYIVEKN